MVYLAQHQVVRVCPQQGSVRKRTSANYQRHNTRMPAVKDWHIPRMENSQPLKICHL